MYIYKIINTVNDKIYIGSTTKPITQRFAQHCNEARRGSQTKLHNEMCLVGIEYFSVELIADVSGDAGLLCEDYWINYYISLLGTDKVLNTNKHAYFPNPQKTSYGSMVQRKTKAVGHSRFYIDGLELIGYEELIAYLHKYDIHISFHSLRHYVTGLRGCTGAKAIIKYPKLAEIMYQAPNSQQIVPMLKCLRQESNNEQI